MTTALLPPALADADWPAQAKCCDPQFDPEWWAAIPGSEEAHRAQRICLGHCPVRAECLAYATESGEPWLIWGGLTDSERRQRAAKPQPPPPPPPPPPAESVLRELAGRGLSDHDISTELGIPASTVTTLRHRYDIPSGLQMRQALAEDPNSTVLTALVEMLREGLPRRIIGNRLGVSRSTIDRWCSRYRLWRLEARRP